MHLNIYRFDLAEIDNFPFRKGPGRPMLEFECNANLRKTHFAVAKYSSKFDGVHILKLNLNLNVDIAHNYATFDKSISVANRFLTQWK